MKGNFQKTNTNLPRESSNSQSENQPSFQPTSHTDTGATISQPPAHFHEQFSLDRTLEGVCNKQPPEQLPPSPSAPVSQLATPKRYCSTELDEIITKSEIFLKENSQHLQASRPAVNQSVCLSSLEPSPQSLQDISRLPNHSGRYAKPPLHPLMSASYHPQHTPSSPGTPINTDKSLISSPLSLHSSSFLPATFHSSNHLSTSTLSHTDLASNNPLDSIENICSKACLSLHCHHSHSPPH